MTKRLTGIKIQFSLTVCDQDPAQISHTLRNRYSHVEMPATPRIEFDNNSIFSLYTAQHAFVVLKQGVVNCMGLKSEDDVIRALSDFCQACGLDCEINLYELLSTVQFDTYSYTCVPEDSRIMYNLPMFYDFIKTHGHEYDPLLADVKNVTITLEHFPGLRIVLENKGKIMFFNSGKFNLLGLKSPSCADELEALVRTLCRDYNRLWVEQDSYYLDPPSYDSDSDNDKPQ